MNNQYNPNNNNNLYNNQYNNYNNGYNNGWPNQMQSPQPNNNQHNDDNRGGGFFSFLFALILLGAAVAFLLHLLGIIDLKELYDKYIVRNDNTQEVDKKEEKTKDKEEKENNLDTSKKELDNMCGLVDNEGSYQVVGKGDSGCSEYLCILTEKDIVYAKDCKTNEYYELDKDEVEERAQQIINLKSKCSIVDEYGNYIPTEPDEYHTSCSDFVCRSEVNGKEYIRACAGE